MLSSKSIYPTYRIGFSNFCQLQRKRCVTVSSNGSHSVCVCSYHQNVKLMCSALPIRHDYTSLMELCICSSKSRNCIFHLCQDCPDKESLLDLLESIFLENCYDMEDNTAYNKWISTDRSSLTTIKSTVQEFVEV